MCWSLSASTIANQTLTIGKESRMKTTLGLKSSQTTTFILQDQTTMSEDHFHHITKSIKSRMTTHQWLKVIFHNEDSTISEANTMKEHLREEALVQEEEEEEEEHHYNQKTCIASFMAKSLDTHPRYVQR